MKFVNALLISLLLCVPAHSQTADSITPNPTKTQLASTFVVDRDTIFGYANQIAMGAVSNNAAESVNSFVMRTKLQAEFSSDGTTYRIGYLTGDSHVRIRTRTEDDWVVIPLLDPFARPLFFQWSAPAALSAWNSYQKWGSHLIWWETGDQSHAPHADKFDHVVYQNGGNVKDTAGNVIATGARGHNVNLQRGTVMRAVGSVTYTDADGNSQTVRASSTTSVWRLLFVLEDQNMIMAEDNAIKARLTALEAGSGGSGGTGAILGGAGITITGTNPRTISVDTTNLTFNWGQIRNVAGQIDENDLASSAKTLDMQFSNDNSTWNDTSSVGDRYFRARASNGAFSESVKLGTTDEEVARKIEEYVESHNLTLPHVPQFLPIHRQFLRRGSAYALDLKELITGELTIQASNLPTGITIQNGVLSGTPTTEQVIFSTITANNDDGSSDIVIPFIVMRNLNFDTSLRGITGLTTRGANINALYGPTAIVYSYSKLGVVSSTTINLRSEPQFDPTNAVGISWRDFGGGTGAYAVLGDTRNESIAKYFTDGNIDGTAITDSRLINAEGITYGNNRYWVVAQTISVPPSAQVIPLDDNLVVQPSERFGIQNDPKGVAFFENRIYVIDNTDNKIYAYDVGSSRGTALPYYNWDLHADNHQPSGIAYLDNYLYVLQAGQGAVNDKFFVYPIKKIYDPSVPNLERLQFISRGTYATGNAVRIRAIFSGPVGVSSDTTLRLNVGGNERQAVSITNSDDVASGGQTNVTVAHFYYQIQASDLDTDGITTYDYPFSTTGIIKHNGDNLPQHYINKDTAYRVTQPAGLNTLFPNPANRVNSLDQADWAQTDLTKPNAILNKPIHLPPAANSINNRELNTPASNGIPGQILRLKEGGILEWWTQVIDYNDLINKPATGTNPQLTVSDTASLGLFEWVRNDSLGIQFVASGTNYTSLAISTISAYNNWTPSVTFNSGQWVLMRIPDDALTALPSVYLQGVGLPDFGGQLSQVSRADSVGNIWHKFSAPNPYLRYTYYAVKASATANGNAFVANRRIRYSSLVQTPEIPPAQVNSDWNATTGKAEILNKPQLPLYYQGETTDSYLGARGRTYTEDVSIPAKLSTYSTNYGEKLIVRINIRWKATDDSSNPTDTVAMRIDVLDSSANAFSPAITIARSNIPQTTQHVTLTGELPIGTTAFKIRATWTAGPADGYIQNYLYKIGLDEQFDDEIIAGTGITVTDNGDQTTIGIADGGVNNGQIADDAIDIAKLDIDDTPIIGEELTFGADGLTFSPRFYPERITADSAVQVSLRTGVPTLSQAVALTYQAEIVAIATARTGQAVVVKFQDGHDIKDYLIHIGNPTSSSNGVTNYRYQLADLTMLGSQGGFQYLSTPVITIPAALPVYVVQLVEYAAKQIVALYESIMGNIRDGITEITVDAPLTITGSASSKRISLPDGTLTPDKLQASNNTQKIAFRNKIGALSKDDLEEQQQFDILGFNAVLSPYSYDLPINLTADIIKEAAGRPYEVQIHGTIDGRNTAENTTVSVEIRSASGTGGILWASTEATSVLGAVANYTLSASIPPTATQFYIRFNRTAGTAPDGFDGEGYGTITIGTLAKNTYVDSSGFDGNLGPGDDNLQKVSQKVDDLEISASGVPETQTIANAQHNGNSGTPAPSSNYAIRADLVTENAKTLWQLYANFTINVHNQQTFGNSTYRYELATASTGGTVLASHTTVSLAGGANQNFTLTSRIPVGTTTLYIRGSRTAGTAGIGLVQIGGSIYVLAEVSADKVDINSAGFNGVLRPGDNTVQKALQKVDDLDIPSEQTIPWTITFSNNTGVVDPTAANTNARRIGNTVWYSSEIIFGGSVAGIRESYINLPVNRTITTLQMGSVTEITRATVFTNTTNLLRIRTNTGSATRKFTISGWYTTE